MSHRYRGRKLGEMRPDGYVEVGVEPGDEITWGDWRDAKYRAQHPETYQAFTLIPYASGSDYSGNLVERSNYQYIVDNYSDEVVTVSGGYGTFGVGFLGRASDLSEGLQDVIAGLHDYPLADESLHSEMEMEAIHEAWHEHGLQNFRSQLKSHYLPNILGFDHPDLGEILDDLETEALTSFWYTNTENMCSLGGARNEQGSEIDFDYDEWFKHISPVAMLRWLNDVFDVDYMLPTGDTARILADAIHDWFLPFADSGLLAA